MKIRNGFVSNSSSSSFIVHIGNSSLEEVNHVVTTLYSMYSLLRKDEEFSSDQSYFWDIYEDSQEKGKIAIDINTDCRLADDMIDILEKLFPDSYKFYGD